MPAVIDVSVTDDDDAETDHDTDAGVETDISVGLQGSKIPLSLSLPNIARLISHPARSSASLAARARQHSGCSIVVRRRTHPQFHHMSSVHPFHVHSRNLLSSNPLGPTYISLIEDYLSYLIPLIFTHFPFLFYTGMDHDTNAEWHTDIATKMSVEPDDEIMVDQPGAMASVDDFPANHWVEPVGDMPIPIPPPTPAAEPLSLPLAPSSSTILERVLALTTQVTAMQMAEENANARVNVMEQEFEARISSMRAELSSMQLDVGTMVTLVNGLVGLVEKLWQERVLANPSFPPPMISHGNESSATTFGMRYLNGVFSPLVTPMPFSVGVSQTSVSCPPRRPDTQGTTFPSG
ncbi:uncharacterized protein F5891DRAFT_1189890 [Suillus fuscotomentosus]|uniref:Uncharacterized protein n=1 Tax=Suillus fuscotomentosus TaxID=1912939 RepID=A0AAD4E483_9AGAM|nr:uncharacterized protein F5891DRAFT_1189890 [Suillus fuscotomentosus]KAG1899438.1 hypothetical protein F5891DRAFT_1189890 [Suillus fuscotomentosus]